jgi:HEPN domain-containing protein
MRDSRAEGGRWLRQAENDLAFARLALRERFFAQACFLSQQVSEKAVKAIAYAAGERLVVGHSLVELVERLRAFGSLGPPRGGGDPRPVLRPDALSERARRGRSLRSLR